MKNSLKVTTLAVIITLTVCFSFHKLGDSCNNFDGENACRGTQTDNDQSWANRSFQTPPRGDSLWR